MVIGTSVGLHDAGTVVPSIVLASVYGYGLTVRGVLRAGLPFARAFEVALPADTVSIAAMEVIDDTVVVAIPGAVDAGDTTALHRASLPLSLATPSWSPPPWTGS